MWVFLDYRVPGQYKRMTGVVVELFRMNDDNKLNVLTLCPFMAVRSDCVLYTLLYRVHMIGSHK